MGRKLGSMCCGEQTVSGELPRKRAQAVALSWLGISRVAGEVGNFVGRNQPTGISLSSFGRS
jgi:hypothetical protein